MDVIKQTFSNWAADSRSVGILLFVFYPILQGVILSTYRWKTVSVKVFTGFDNYIGVFQTPVLEVMKTRLYSCWARD